MSIAIVPPAPSTLIDLIDRSRVRDAVAVVGFALLTAVAAQISIPLGFTPVPLTGQTFAVLLAGGVLGSRRGGLSMLLYVALGAIGLPFYADGAGGWTAATGATAGYLVGFIVAAIVVGLMAEHGQDRKLSTSIPAFIAGTMIIYTIGAGWLAYDLVSRVQSHSVSHRSWSATCSRRSSPARCCPQRGVSSTTPADSRRRVTQPVESGQDQPIEPEFVGRGTRFIVVEERPT